MNLLVPGVGCELPVEEGSHGVHPCDGGDRGGWGVDHQDIHHTQDYGTQIQGINSFIR